MPTINRPDTEVTPVSRTIGTDQLVDKSNLPVAGIETTRKVLDNSLPSNALMERAGPL
jgi:hypothetical protein